MKRLQLTKYLATWPSRTRWSTFAIARGVLRSRAIIPLFVLFIFYSPSQSQQYSTSSLRSKADSLLLHLRELTAISPSAEVVAPEKCGFRYQFETKRYWSLLSTDERAFVQSIFQRPTMQTSILSPTGRFRVHFDTSGVNAPALLDNSGNRIPGTARAYADSVASVFEFVRQFETVTLGYPGPPGDRGAGGGNEYDVYVRELSRSFYGQTVFNPEEVLDAQRPNPTYASYIEIDNDYRNYFSPGMKGLRITAAHELHHAIQVGNYGFWSNDVYYYELTSTWIEDEVYTNSNDYYQYLPSYFSSTTTPFNVSNGFIEYGRGLWGKFVQKRFGRDTMRRSWEYMSSVRSLPAIDAALRERGAGFVRELAEFSMWHFFTGLRADPLNYFPSGAAYPEVRIIDNGTFVPPTALVSNTMRPLSFQFYRVTVPRATGGSDAITIDVTNLNVQGGLQTQDANYPFSYRLTTDRGDETYLQLQNGVNFKLAVDDPANWKSFAFVNQNLSVEEKTDPFPNPFIAGKSGGVAFPINSGSNARATLTIYSTGFSLVVSKVADSMPQFGRQVVLWDGKDSKGEFVPSGIYMYHLSAAGKEYKGKIAVVRN